MAFLLPALPVFLFIKELKMAKQIQLRRGSTAEHENFIGATGEVTVDTDLNTLRVHDGTTPGGHIVRGAQLPDSADYVVESKAPSTATNNMWYRKYKSGWVEQGAYLGGVSAQTSKKVIFPIPYKQMHDYFIFALGTNPNVTWSGGDTRTGEFCTIKNSSNETNYIDVYTCGWAA